MRAVTWGRLIKTYVLCSETKLIYYGQWSFCEANTPKHCQKICFRSKHVSIKFLWLRGVSWIRCLILYCKKTSHLKRSLVLIHTRFPYAYGEFDLNQCTFKGGFNVILTFTTNVRFWKKWELVISGSSFKQFYHFDFKKFKWWNMNEEWTKRMNSL